MLHQTIAEIQGLYGPVSVSERVLHTLWIRLQFSRNGLKTASGTPISILEPGTWNRHEGPDFRGCVYSLDGKPQTGDVEIHLYERDWINHGHHTDPNFDSVRLHVILFQQLQIERRSIHTSKGLVPETLVLLPYLENDIESCATEQAIESLTIPDRQRLLDWFLALETFERRQRLIDCGLNRWRQKMAFAHQRIKQYGWNSAVHQTTMEVLGYSRNRGPMSALACHYPLETIGQTTPDRLFLEMADRWKLSGIRPHNQPRRRLEQYLELVRRNPEWPQMLLKWGSNLPQLPPLGQQTLSSQTRNVRRDFAFPAARQALVTHVLESIFDGPRLDTLVYDAFLPLLSATHSTDYAPWWFHWKSGDIPDSVRLFLTDIEVYSPSQPTCNGYNQGALEFFLRDRRQ